MIKDSIKPATLRKNKSKNQSKKISSRKATL